MYENHPLLSAVKNNNFKMVKIITDYAGEQNISLNFYVGNNRRLNPFLDTLTFNKIKIFQLFIKYAYDHQIILQLHCKDKIRKLSPINDDMEK